MYKVIPKATDYEISTKDGTIRRKDGNLCELPFRKINDLECVTLKIGGITRTLSIKWLKLMSHFEVDLDSKYFFNVEFRPMKDWQYANSVRKVMIFRNGHPEYKPGFRIVPNFTRYAVSKEGVLIDTHLGTEVTIAKGLYPICTVYDPDINKVVSRGLHRLVALAWIENPSYEVFYIINHKDGNKHNCLASNLEWTDHSGNIDHAFRNGLRDENRNCKVRNIETGEITEFNSISDASNFMGVTKKPYSEFLRHGVNRPINGLYEVRTSNDSTPWNLSLYKLDDPNCKSIITLTDKNGITTIYHGYKKLCEKLDIPFNKKCKVMNKVLKSMGYELKVKKLTSFTKDIEQIQVYVIKTEEIQTFLNIRETSKRLNVNISTIKNCLCKGENFVTNGFAYRYKTNKKWNTNFRIAINSPNRILGICTDGRRKEFTSLLDVLRQTGINTKTVAKTLRTGVQVSSTWNFVKV